MFVGIRAFEARLRDKLQLDGEFVNDIESNYTEQKMMNNFMQIWGKRLEERSVI